MPFSLKLLFFEAFLTSGWVKLTLTFFEPRRVAGWQGRANFETPADPDPATLELRKQVRLVLGLCNSYAPWPTECYTRALTGKLLLKRRAIDSTLYIGFKKDDSGNYKGHAWLRSRDTYITGYYQSQEFSINYIFS